eukprot:CAMPEP_0182454330 /NCGR_PEP_ID=MMETSP1319-20130603/1015_1 /TAXON_ID=172717 /ORGANISM="Bolidomonas pacifica, Strain RCC208" /LENGTH=241 /DNA_ID=CAMNT_0024652337 /DNA_START=31 /DNA_END=752 /DNA_ORIENTATION=+
MSSLPQIKTTLKKLSPLRKKSYSVLTNTQESMFGAEGSSPQKMFKKTYLFPAPDPSGLDMRRIEKEKAAMKLKLQAESTELVTRLVTEVAMRRPEDALKFVVQELSQRSGTEGMSALNLKREAEALSSSVSELEIGLSDLSSSLAKAASSVPYSRRTKCLFVTGASAAEFATKIAEEYNYSHLSCAGVSSPYEPMSGPLLSFSRVVLEVPVLTAEDIGAFQARYPQCAVVGVVGEGEDWEG